MLIETMALARTGILLLWLVSVVLSSPVAIGQINGTSSPHYVFAHYMVCYATYGATVGAYKREIQEAQAAGIDGFALNVGAWSGPDTYYKTRVELIYEAAEQLGTGFKLFFSVDLSNTNDIVNMVSSYAPRTNSFRYQGKIVLSTFSESNLDWNGVFHSLKDAGTGVFFVPFFYPNPTTELPKYQDAVNLLNTYSNILDGLFLFGAAGLPYQLAQCNSNYTLAVHSAGKIFMAGVTPHYWGCKQPSIDRRYFEFDGGEGISLQWHTVIASQPDWVEIVTWNDFNESSYISPVEDPGQYFDGVVTPHRYSHKGYFELSKHYIAWFKNGREPVIQNDALYYFYRTHSKNSVASDTNDVPVTWYLGNVQDTFNATVFLIQPAQLTIASGVNRTTNSLPAGISAIRVPFAPGTQTMTLVRNGEQVFSVQGSNILSQIQSYDFFPASGFAYGKPSPPVGFHASGSLQP